MTWLDIAVLAVIAASIAWGVWRGLVHEVLSLAGWVLAFFAANLASAPLADALPKSMQPEVRTALAWLGVFVIVVLATSLGAILLARVIKVVGLAATDRWLGALFGLARGILIVLAFALVAGLTKFPQQAAWKDSFSDKPLANTVEQLKPWLPAALAQRLRYH